MIDFISKFYEKAMEECNKVEIISVDSNDIFFLIRELGLLGSTNNPLLAPYNNLVKGLLSKTYKNPKKEFTFSELQKLTRTEKKISSILEPFKNVDLLEIVIQTDPVERKIILNPLFQKFSDVFNKQVNTGSNLENQEHEKTARTLLGLITLQLFYDYINDFNDDKSKVIRTTWIKYLFLFITVYFKNTSFNESNIDLFLKKRKISPTARELFKDLLKNVHPSYYHKMIKDTNIRKGPGMIDGELLFEFTGEFINGINQIRDYTLVRTLEREN
ncbi:MAG: hypothetical protein HeimC3_48430 [Candidatus Heimdallarchaeota archaeon LC_3]|nr:MAG: hypothetical protein HeimC3_48430 [Candidatus Heimdallarchaeota archaeon LC_3]